MLKALWLLIEPRPVWERLSKAKPGLARVSLTLLVPLLALACAFEGYGFARWGKPRGDSPEAVFLRKLTVAESVAYELIQIVFVVAITLFAAWIVRAVARSFHGRQTYPQAFTTVAYGLSPLVLVQALDGFPAINPWVSWGVGMALVARVMYQGIPRVMLPDPPNAFGLYLTSVVLLLTATGLARFFSSAYLNGNLRAVEEPLVSLISKLIH